jgi:D-alanine transaminase
MSRIAYVNGRYVPHGRATVSIDDRGYQFADAVYEVCAVSRGSLIDERAHMDRLARSLQELRIAAPLRTDAFRIVLREVVARNKVRDGYVYIQVTRGVARRDHVFPENVHASVIVTARPIDPRKGDMLASKGVHVVTMPDLRWKRVDIKATCLLPNVLARQTAKDKGAYEAWLIDDDGMVTEGAASNAWIIDQAGTIITHQVGHSILAGITRATLMTVIKRLGMRIEERKFSPAEALAAKEAFITSTTSLVMPVVAIDGHAIGEGAPGIVVQKLRAHFHEAAEASP